MSDPPIKAGDIVRRLKDDREWVVLKVVAHPNGALVLLGGADDETVWAGARFCTRVGDQQELFE